MSDLSHISQTAVGLASLPPTDPERIAAYVHGRTCAECALALRQAEELLAKLDAVPATPGPSALTLRAITRPILAELSALAVPIRSLSVILVMLWLVLVAAAKHRAGGGVAWGESVALVAVAVASAALLRRVGSLALGLAFGASALLAALAWGEGPLDPRHGLACLLTELGAAIVPVIVVGRTLLKRGSARPTLPLASTAAAGALVGQAALHLTCPDHTAGMHILAFHIGGVVLAVLMTVLVARLFTRSEGHDLAAGGA